MLNIQYEGYAFMTANRNEHKSALCLTLFAINIYGPGSRHHRTITFLHPAGNMSLWNNVLIALAFFVIVSLFCIVFLLFRNYNWQIGPTHRPSNDISFVWERNSDWSQYFPNLKVVKLETDITLNLGPYEKALNVLSRLQNFSRNCSKEEQSMAIAHLNWYITL